MKLIELTQSKFTKVDDRDYAYLNQWKWRAHKSYKNCYRANRGVIINGKFKEIRMPNIIMNPQSGYVVDHINSDTLDNRRKNLRVCTPKQNSMNKKIHEDKKSIRLKGVYPQRNPHNGRWRSYIGINGKQIYLGAFACPLLAKLTYNKELVRVHGEFANFG